LRHFSHIALLALFCACFSSAFAESTDAESTTAEPTEVAPIEQADSKPRKNYLAAYANAQVSNLALFSINRFIRKADYATGVDFESMQTNCTSKWVWDQDEFSVNHLGHPYQGSFYYIAGRANGLSFGESALVALTGSVTWELFYETETPSWNDLVLTPMGGIAVGEMLHRLYLEAEARNLPGSFLISPMDAFNGLVTGDKSQHQGSGIHSGELGLKAGFMNKWSDYEEKRNADIPESAVAFNIGYGLVYGDPYAHATRTPYSHFTQELAMTFAENYHSVVFFSDGLLASFAPIDDEERRTTVGMSLHYDFLFTSHINFATTALGLTVKHERRYSNDALVQIQAHVSWMPVAASDCIYLRYGNAPEPSEGEERRDYDLATGPSVKFTIAASQPVAGSLRLSCAWYGMKTIPASVPDYGSGGKSMITIVDISYERNISEEIAVGLSNSFFSKLGSYSDKPSIDERTNLSSCYLRYLF